MLLNVRHVTREAIWSSLCFKPLRNKNLHKRYHLYKYFVWNYFIIC